MRKKLKPYGLFTTVLLINLVLTLLLPRTARLSMLNAASFLGDILLVLPPVLVLMGLFDVWVPRQVVERSIGQGSGVRGAILAMLLGTAAAGPLYVAFPVALALQQKGARLANIVVFLGTWATIKIPMLLVESSFLGWRFSLIRLALTIPAILLSGFLMERWVPETATATASEER